MNRRELHDTFDQLLDAIAAETAAKDDKGLNNDVRFVAQEKVIGLMHELQKETGILDLLQRRIVVDIRGIANGTPVLASALPAKKEDYEGKAGERLLRDILSRVALDSGTLPDIVEGRIAARMLFAKEGYRMGDAFGSLSEPVPRAGRSSDKGADFALRLFFVAGIGYSVGYEDRPDTRLVTRDIFERACRALRAKRGGLMNLPAYETVRSWCYRDETDKFNECRRGGAADRASGKKPDPDIYLPL